MLTDAELNLLTAAADGELPADKLAALARLLAASAEAAGLHRELLADRNRLRSLPVRTAPDSVIASITARVAAEPRSEIRRPSRSARWFPVAVAASAMLVVGSGSFLFFQPKGPITPAAQALALPKIADVPVDPKLTAFNTDPPAGFTGPPKPKPDTVVKAVPSTAATPRERLPVPRPSAGEGLLASPVGPPIKPFSGVDLRLPLLMPVSELSAPAGRKQFLDELPADGAVRIDLFAADTLKGIDVLSVAANNAHVTWTFDALTAERHKLRQQLSYAVFTESLTPTELTALFSAASVADWSKVFASVHVVPPAAADFRDWKELTGAEPPAAKKNKLDTKNVVAATADQVTTALQKSQKADKALLVLTYLPTANRINPQASKEVAQFNAKRAEKKPGTLSVMIVVRPLSQ